MLHINETYKKCLYKQVCGSYQVWKADGQTAFISERAFQKNLHKVVIIFTREVKTERMKDLWNDNEPI